MSQRRWLFPGVAACLLCTQLAFAGEIHQAIARGDKARVEELLRGDPQLLQELDANATRDYPLHTAAIGGQVEIARLLLDRGADLECGDIDGSTPLHDATLMRKREMVDLLLSKGADVRRRDRNGGYALSFAVSGGDSVIIRKVLDAGADLDFSAPATGNTLMHFAGSRGLFWLVDVLRAREMDINVGNNNGETLLHWICNGRFSARIEPALARGANPALVDSFGRTPLANASWSGQPEAIRVLLAHGVEVDALDRQGNTPLYGAAARGSAECVRQLLEHGANARVVNKAGATPMRWAVGQGSGEVAKLLLQAGASPQDVDPEFGWTLLHKAAALGFEDIARSLMDQGAELDAKDDQGRTPLQLAEQYGQTVLAGELRARGAKGKSPNKPIGLASVPKLDPGEAEIWYLGHSGWAVKTANHFLVFDYGDMGRRSDQPTLTGGDIAPAEIARERVTVFASHEHGDHFMPSIFDWRAQVPQIDYVCGFRPQNLQNNPAYEYIEPHQTGTVAGMKVTTIQANDSGEGFVVEVDGLTIFHPGDHTRRAMDGSDGFQVEIDGLVQKGVRPDIAFIPLSGCSMTDQTPVRLGTEYVLNTMQPKTLFPMHGGLWGNRYVEFVDGIKDRYPRTCMLAASCKGDHFRYRNGKAS